MVVVRESLQENAAQPSSVPMTTDIEPVSPAPSIVAPEQQGPPETPSSVATIAIAAMCLPLPLLIGASLLSHALTGWSSPNGFDIIFFFTYLPLLVLSICIVEPLVLVLTIMYTNRGTKGPVSPVRLLVCWTALIVHSLVLLWLVTRNGPRS